MLLLAGCVQPAMMPRINYATARVLDAVGVQTVIADKAGWLRARNARGASAWRNDDLLCRTPDGTAQSVAGRQEDALSRILRLMDAEPVRYVKGGRVHGTVF